MLTITLPPSSPPHLAAEDAETLHLAVLGPPTVRMGERPLAFRTRKEFALLAYLALSRSPRSREHLAGMLWPDRDGVAARGTLRTALSRLRQAVAAAAGLPAEALTLFSTTHDALGRDVIRLTDQGTPRLVLDTALLEASAAAKGDPLGGVTHERLLVAAVTAYHGPFLADVSFNDAPELEDWVQEQRAFWQRQVEVVLARLAALQLQRRAFTEAGATAECWIEIDSLAEAAYRALMRARAGAGDRAGALTVYEECRATLRGQLAVDPAPETVALAERLRRLTAEPVRPAPPSNRGPSESSGAAGPAAPEVELPFAGREREFAALVEAYRSAQAGKQRVVVIEGEAKIGKTRLAEEFLRWAALEEADVVQARGLATGQALPYQVVVDALRPRLAREHAPEDLVDEVWLIELVRLFPELRERYLDLPAPSQLADDATALGRLFEAVHQLERALAEQARPGALVACCDDLHWADRASLDLYLHGTQRAHEIGVPRLTVLTVRTEALATVPEMGAWLARLAQSVPTTHLVLGPLDRAETEQALETVLAPDGAAGDDASRFLVRTLYARTGGHPFYLVETLREFVGRGILVAREAAPHPGQRATLLGLGPAIDRLPPLVPGAVCEQVREQLSGLKPAAVDLLTATAVLESDATFERLCEVAGIDEWVCLAALDELGRRGLLVEARPDPLPGDEWPEQPATYRFPYELLRQVVCAEAGTSRCYVFHRRALADLNRDHAPLNRPAALDRLPGNDRRDANRAFVARERPGSALN